MQCIILQPMERLCIPFAVGPAEEYHCTDRTVQCFLVPLLYLLLQEMKCSLIQIDFQVLVMVETLLLSQLN